MPRRRKFNRVQLEGVEELEVKLRRMEEGTQGRTLRAATEEGAGVLVRHTSRLAPRSLRGSRGNPPGFLASRIQYETQFTRRQDRALVHVGAHKDAYYGGILEVTGHPFMRPAFDAHKDEVTATVAAALRARILRIARGT